MANLNPFWSVIIVASASRGAVVEAAVHHLLDHLVQK